MKHFSSAVLASLVITTPSLVAYPNVEIPVFSIQTSFEMPDLRNLSYDEVMDLLELIESDSFEERCSIDQLDQVNRLISFLAMEGSTENEKSDVGMSIASLFKEDYFPYAYWMDSNVQYATQPAIFRDGSQNIIHCKSWVKKQWHQTKKFVKKHKKEIIIGAIVVVAVTVVVVAAVAISASAAAAAAGGAAATAGSLDSESSHSHQKDNSNDSIPEEVPSSHVESLTSSLQEQISTFKENIAPEQVAAISNENGISLEENGRIIGSLFTHKTIDTLITQAGENPLLGYELQNLGFNSNCPLPKWAIASTTSPHASADLAFSTNYSPTYVGGSTDLNTMAYQARGDWALSSGYYAQAVQDFGRAIEMEPNNLDSYLGRGFANFELGFYEKSVADYKSYISEAKQPSSATDFSIGFAKGLPKGIYDSGEGILMFVTDLASHPIQTSEKVYDSISMLSRLAKSGEWNLIAETLSPELHQLVSEWDSLSAKEKGELSGYAFGKHGTDILLPGATAKAVAKGSTIARELGAVCKNLQSAEKLLVLETVAEGSTAGVNIGEVVISAEQTFLLESAVRLERDAKIAEIIPLEKRVSKWLGEGTKFIRNEAEDPIFLSKDGLRCVRFDFNKTTPHNNPHAHIEIKVDGKWIKSGQIYPTDVPHN